MPIRFLMSAALLFAATSATADEPASADGPPAVTAAADPTTSETTAPATPAPPAGSGAAVAQAEPRPVTAVAANIDTAAQQIQTGEYREAEIQLSASIAQIERDTSRYDRSLAQPLMLLGDALSGQAKYDEALPLYEQARHIIRVNDGLHAPAQVEILYREANALAAMGEIDKANARQEYAYDTMFRNHDKYDEALVPGVLHLAAWYEQTLNTFAARGLYEYAALIETRAHGEMDPRLIAPLEGLARTYREERFPPYRVPQSTDSIEMVGPGGFPATDRPITINRFGQGEQALVQIVRITQANPNATPLDVALAELNLADWYLLFDNDERAVTIYVHARQVMRAQAGLNEDQITAYFTPPKSLWLPIPSNPPAPEVRANPTEGHVEVSYTLTEDGKCTDLHTVASQPEGLMDMKVRRGLRVARFRPQFAGDVPVSAANMVYRHTFTYYPRPEAPDAAQDRAKAPDDDQPDAPEDPGA
jgi:TonB family protein